MTDGNSVAIDPVISSIGENVYIVWNDFRTGAGEVFFRHSSNRGETWEPVVQLTNTSMVNYAHPKLAADEKNLHIIYRDKIDDQKLEIYYIRSTNYGVDWLDSEKLTNKPNFWYNN